MAKLILIKEHLRFFYFRQAKWLESWTPFLKATILILPFFIPKNFKTSLKYVQTNLVNLTAKGTIVSLQKIP